MRLVPRKLPPAGGVVPLRAVVGSLGESLNSFSKKKLGAHDLRRQLAERTGMDHWVLTNSGRSALSVILMALNKLDPGRDEVVLPAYTSYSVPAAVVRAGLRVRLCDVELETLGISPKELERSITSRTLCVVPSHLYGIPCQISLICEIARDHNFPVVEDAAQALGAGCISQPVGTFGEAAVFSLSRGKSLPAGGGGLIGTNDKRLAMQCKRALTEYQKPAVAARLCGIRSVLQAVGMSTFIRPSLYWIPASIPFLKLGASVYDPYFEVGPMSSFQKNLATRVLPSLDAQNSLRRSNAMLLSHGLTEFQDVRVLWPVRSDSGTFLRLPVLINHSARRARVIQRLQKEGLGASSGYPLPLSEIPELRPHLVRVSDDFPVARYLSTHLLTLPTHPWVTSTDIDRIIAIFQECSR